MPSQSPQPNLIWRQPKIFGVSFCMPTLGVGYTEGKIAFFSNPARNQFICCQMVSGERNRKNFRKIFIFRLPKAKKLALLMFN